MPAPAPAEGRLRIWARRLKRDLAALRLAARHPRVPRLAKIVAVATVAYALSPIDLIPDFVPVLGLLDDLILVPLGLWLAIRLIPPDVLVECRAQAEAAGPAPRSRAAAGVILAIWLALAAFLVSWALA